MKETSCVGSLIVKRVEIPKMSCSSGAMKLVVGEKESILANNKRILIKNDMSLFYISISIYV